VKKKGRGGKFRKARRVEPSKRSSILCRVSGGLSEERGEEENLPAIVWRIMWEEEAEDETLHSEARDFWSCERGILLQLGVEIFWG